MSDARTTLLVDREAAVLWVRLNRPDARNAIDITVRDELVAVLTVCDEDPGLRAVVVTGQGTDFCTGADLMPPSDPTQAAAAIEGVKARIDGRRPDFTGT
jgi:enoyl-CoA hydratase/carnithine racemase